MTEKKNSSSDLTDSDLNIMWTVITDLKDRVKKLEQRPRF